MVSLCGHGEMRRVRRLLRVLLALDVWVGRNGTETESPEPIQLRSWLQLVRGPVSGRGYCISAAVGSKGVSVGEVPVMTRVLREPQETTGCQGAAR